jgi:hypothetical protein
LLIQNFFDFSRTADADNPNLVLASRENRRPQFSATSANQSLANFAFLPGKNFQRTQILPKNFRLIKADAVLFPVGLALFGVKLKFHFQSLKCSIAAKPTSFDGQTKKAAIAGRLCNFA